MLKVTLKILVGNVGKYLHDKEGFLKISEAQTVGKKKNL